MYRDYPISPTLFHWESQSTTTVQSPTGQRYLNGTSNVLLFVREHHLDDFGTAPYLFLGPSHYVSHEGERPIAITCDWSKRCPRSSSPGVRGRWLVHGPGWQCLCVGVLSSCASCDAGGVAPTDHVRVSRQSSSRLKSVV